ncbi:hypothetical protein [Halalkalicoccus sp. NIPERK01]|uniref:hypothetical protein n=1 Tax=Halalkalicoccus sp. NIPERK01 TaxID=3053469 RepID=UPI00256F423F
MVALATLLVVEVEAVAGEINLVVAEVPKYDVLVFGVLFDLDGKIRLGDRRYRSDEAGEGEGAACFENGASVRGCWWSVRHNIAHQISQGLKSV